MFGDGSVAVIDTEPSSSTYHSEVDTIRFDGHIGELVFSGDSTRAVVDSAADSVLLLDTATNRHTTVAVGSYPWDVAVSPDGRRAYVLNLHDDSVSMVDTSSARVTATLALGTNRLESP